MRAAARRTRKDVGNPTRPKRKCREQQAGAGKTCVGDEPSLLGGGLQRGGAKQLRFHRNGQNVVWSDKSIFGAPSGKKRREQLVRVSGESDTTRLVAEGKSASRFARNRKDTHSFAVLDLGDE